MVLYLLFPKLLACFGVYGVDEGFLIAKISRELDRSGSGKGAYADRRPNSRVRFDLPIDAAGLRVKAVHPACFSGYVEVITYHGRLAICYRPRVAESPLKL